jgi:hypothetical protein
MKTTRKKTKFGTIVSTGYTDKEWAKLRAKPVKPLNVEMAWRHIKALEKLLGAGDITPEQYQRLRRDIIARVVA